MKKNKFLRLASFMLIACLATCCAVGGTFAKYVTSATSNDSARVAKFGVEVTVTGENAFAMKYDDTASDTGTKVVSDVDVVAPGTNGTLATFAITGTPEVAVRITKTATLTLTGDWKVDGDFYCPLTIAGVSGLDYTSADAFAAAVKAGIEAANGDYDANTDLSTITEMNGNYTWSWAFEKGADDAEKAENNKKDTVLGDKAVAGDITISFSLEITVTQID